MLLAHHRDVGSFVIERVNAGQRETAGAGNDNAVKSGFEWIDITDKGWESCVAWVVAHGAINAGETLSIKDLQIWHADDSSGTGAALFKDQATDKVLSPSGGEVHGVHRLKADLTGAKSHVQIRYTPDASRANTDTYECIGGFSFGGGTDYPTT